MSLNFVIPEFNINGAGIPPLQFFRRGFILNGSGGSQPSWKEITISGVGSVSLVNAIKDGLVSLRLFGGYEQNGTPTPSSPVDIVCNNGMIKAFCGNKWTDVNKLSGHIIQVSAGEIQANSNYNVSAPIFLKAGGYSVSYYTPSSGAKPFTIWESNAQGDLIGERSIFYIGRPAVGTNTGTFTIDRDMYVRISWRNDFTDIVVAPTTAIIYYDGTVETVNVHSKNLFDGAWETGIYSTSTGVKVPANNRIRSVNKTIIQPATTYTLSLVDATPVARWCFYDENQEFISSASKATATTPDNAHYATIYLAQDYTVETAPLCQIEVGSTATTYEPYFNGGSLECPMLLSVGS